MSHKFSFFPSLSKKEKMVYTAGKVCYKVVSNELFSRFADHREKKSSKSVTEVRSYIRKSVFIRMAKWWGGLTMKTMNLSQEGWIPRNWSLGTVLPPLCQDTSPSSAVLWGRERGYTGGSMLLVAISQLFDLQAVPVLGEAGGITDMLPWALSGLTTPKLTGWWCLRPGVSPDSLCCSNMAVLPLSRQRSDVRLKRRLNFVPTLVASSHHHYHGTWCQHVAQSMKNTVAGPDSGGWNAALVPEPASRIEGQWWHSDCLTPGLCVSANCILVSWL